MSSRVPRVGEASAIVGLISLLAGSAHADLELVIEYVDPPGDGFFDEAPRPPLRDNPGTTLGEQRRLAFEHALDIWGAALDSEVPVVVEATFAPIPELPCESDAAVLGAARAEAAFAGVPGAPRGDLFYPSPLADKLAESDLDPGNPDVSALFNPRLDDADCLGDLGWDYALDGAGRGGLVTSVLHELAHGLGFASLVDEVTGEAPNGVSIFEAFMLDRRSGLTWDVMTPEERRESVTSPYDLVWAGEHVTAAAPEVLALGAPHVELSNGDAVSTVSEPSFAPFVEGSGPSGELLALDAEAACSETSSLSDRIVLLSSGDECPDLVEQLVRVGERGAEGALTRSLYDGEPPFGIAADVVELGITSLALSGTAFDELVELLDEVPGLTARFGVDDALVGADDRGRVRLSATRPVQPGSSGSHWDASVRRAQRSPSDPAGLLMEPTAGNLLEVDVFDLSAQLLFDVGWAKPDDVEPGADACAGDCGPAAQADASSPRVEPEPLVEPEASPGRPSEPEARDPGPTADAAIAMGNLDATPSGERRISAESCGCRLGARAAPPWALLLVLTALLRRACVRRGRAAQGPCVRS